ncbi:LamG-like jellyroll fold domain-containing protein [Nonomuraea sp. NPDC004580]|uniref:LamG-like jellyroll fold domain-containing protein n=1 Tax=Nonomuraea sp. NPDC004580 TaxID=3154552 RepID=UPI0033B1DBF8
MAVRFDADGESYTRTISLGTVTNWSFCCWVKLAVDRAAATVLAQIDNGSGSSRFRINAWNGTAVTFQTDSGGWFGNVGHTLSVGSWSFVGVSGTSNPGQVRTAARAAGSTTWAGGQSSQTNVTFSANTLRIGDGQAASEWLNGSLAAVKVWDQALTVDELRQESWAYLPVRTTGLRGWYPFLAPGTVDYSGGGWTLSGGSGAATDDGPPIPWRSGRRLVVFPASTPPVDAEFAANLPPLAASAAGEVTVTGQLAAALPPLDADITAHLGNNAQLDAALPALAASLTGQLDVTATLDATLPALTTDIAVEAEANVVEAVLPALTATLAGQLDITAQLAATLPPLTVELTGETIPPHGDITITTPGPQRGWAAGTPARTWTAPAAIRGWNARPPTT